MAALPDRDPSPCPSFRSNFFSARITTTSSSSRTVRWSFSLTPGVSAQIFSPRVGLAHVHVGHQHAALAAQPLLEGHPACALPEDIVEETVHLAMKRHERIATEATSREAAASEG
jgi:hypothetical protein